MARGVHFKDRGDGRFAVLQKPSFSFLSWSSNLSKFHPSSSWKEILLASETRPELGSRKHPHYLAIFTASRGFGGEKMVVST